MMSSIRDRFYYKCDSIFVDVNPKLLDKLKLHSRTIEVKKDFSLFKEGEFSDGVYLLKKGKVKIFQRTPSGKFQIVYIYTKNEFFGFRPLLSDLKHSVSASALEDSELLFYPKEPFLKLLDTSPVLMKNLLFTLSYEFNIWVNRLTAFSHKGVKERIALALLILNEKHKSISSDKNVLINLAREDIASMSSTTVETCVRVLTQFKESEIISINGRKIKILDENIMLSYADVF